MIGCLGSTRVAERAEAARFDGKGLAICRELKIMLKTLTAEGGPSLRCQVRHEKAIADLGKGKGGRKEEEAWMYVWDLGSLS